MARPRRKKAKRKRRAEDVHRGLLLLYFLLHRPSSGIAHDIHAKGPVPPPLSSDVTTANAPRSPDVFDVTEGSVGTRVYSTARSLPDGGILDPGQREVFLISHERATSSPDFDPDRLHLLASSPLDIYLVENSTFAEQLVWYHEYICRSPDVEGPLPAGCPLCHSDQECFRFGDCCPRVFLQVSRLGLLPHGS